MNIDEIKQKYIDWPDIRKLIAALEKCQNQRDEWIVDCAQNPAICVKEADEEIDEILK